MLIAISKLEDELKAGQEALENRKRKVAEAQTTLINTVSSLKNAQDAVNDLTEALNVLKCARPGSAARIGGAKMSDLDKMIEAVEGGANHSDFAALFPYPICDNARMAQDGSLDAAKALHEALLPGWGWYRVNDRMGVELGLNSHFSHRDSSPARAWLIAILKAYRAQQEVMA